MDREVVTSGEDARIDCATGLFLVVQAKLHGIFPAGYEVRKGQIQLFHDEIEVIIQLGKEDHYVDVRALSRSKPRDDVTRWLNDYNSKGPLAVIYSMWTGAKEHFMWPSSLDKENAKDRKAIDIDELKKRSGNGKRAIWDEEVQQFVQMSEFLTKQELHSAVIEAMQGQASIAAMASPTGDTMHELLIEGVYCLYKPPENEEPEFDVVFFHGLLIGTEGEQWKTTWMTRSNEDPQCWPQTWLPETFRKARVLAFSYNSSATEWLSRPLRLWDNAINCLNSLVARNVRLGKRPYFLVGHSMGGLLAKEVLLRADTLPFRDTPFAKNCKGLVFYGVPHLGTNAVDWAGVLNATLGGIGRLSSFVTDELGLLGEHSRRRNLDFRPLESKYPAYNFAEELPTYGVVIVPASVAGYNAQADNLITVEANHFDVCKPLKRTDRIFSLLVDFIQGRLEA